MGALNLPACQLQGGVVTVIQIRIHDLHRAAAEIRHEVIIKIAKHGAGKNRPRATQQKSVVAVVAAVLKKCPAVELQHAVQLCHEVRIRGSHAETAAADDNLRLRLGRGRGVVLSISRSRSRMRIFLSSSSILFPTAPSPRHSPQTRSRPDSIRRCWRSVSGAVWCSFSCRFRSLRSAFVVVFDHFCNFNSAPYNDLICRF